MKKSIIQFQITICLIFFSVLLPSSLEGQNDTSNANAYSWFDAIISKTNSGIFKGTEYFERYKRLNERHQYFETYIFSTGSVTFDGQFYPDIPIKYDVFDEKLLVQDPNTLNAPIVELDNNKIHAFTINDHNFIHISPNDQSEVDGFYEILIEKNVLSLYKKHLKEIIRKSDEKVAYLDKQVASYQFKDKYEYMVTYNGGYYTVKKVKDLNAIFIDQKASLKTLYKKYKEIKKTDPDGYMKAIMTEILTILYSKNTSVK